MKNSIKTGINPTTSLLHSVGLKATPARIAVLELLKKTSKPLSIKSIQSKLAKEEIDQATLYRIVSSLVEKEIIREVDLKHGHGHYELATSSHHHHIICKKCGKIQDIDCDTTQIEKEVLKQSGFKSISNHSLEFFGTCKSCSS